MILSLIILLPLTNGLFVSDLYPFGTEYGDKLLQNKDQEDISSQEIKLNTSVKFFSRSYDGIFVSFHAYVKVQLQYFYFR